MANCFSEELSGRKDGANLLTEELKIFMMNGTEKSIKLLNKRSMYSLEET